jgi:hypothetical protein
MGPSAPLPENSRRQPIAGQREIPLLSPRARVLINTAPNPQSLILSLSKDEAIEQDLMLRQAQHEVFELSL